MSKRNYELNYRGTPDNWVVVAIKDYHKILCGWSGGYLDGDRWRANSGISKITEDDKAYYVQGLSGSVYKCWKGQETLRRNCSYIYDEMKKADDTIKIVPMEDIKNLYEVKE